MTVAAILPIKRFGHAKQRLAGALGNGTRSAMAAAMVADVLTALERSDSIDAIVAVSAEPEVKAHAVESDLALVADPTEEGQSSAAMAGLARAADLGFEVALLVPGDCPMMSPADLDALTAAAVRADVVIVPDRHGTGTNALAMRAAGPFEPQFGPGSRERHVAQAEARELSFLVEHLPSLALDVDTPDDLAALMDALEETRGDAARTRGILSQIERFRLASTVLA